MPKPPTRKPETKPSKSRSSKKTASRAKTSTSAGRTNRTAASKQATPPMFQKVAFTMFCVNDPTRARSFYEQTLGFKRGLASPDGTWTEYDLPSGGCLALFHHPKPEFRGSPGGASIAFEVSDLDALNERLRAAGVDYQGDMVHGPNCRMSNIKDSEGNTIILHQLNHK